MENDSTATVVSAETEAESTEGTKAVISDSTRGTTSEDTGAVVTAGDDPIEHPAYYADSKIEVIDFIEDRGFGYCLGCACKYISRAGKKYPGNRDKEIEDLRKAIWYINRRICEIEGGGVLSESH